MKIEQGRVYAVVFRGERRIVRVLGRADGVMQWRCDDGWVWPARVFSAATTEEIAAHLDKEARQAALIRAATDAGVFD